METIRSKPIGGLIQEGRYLRGRGVGGEDFREERGIISPTSFEEELTGGSALRERSGYISKNVKTTARDGNATGAEVGGVFADPKLLLTYLVAHAESGVMK